MGYKTNIDIYIIIYRYVQCEAPKIAKLVYKSNFTMVYGTYNELVTGANLNQLITGGPHIVYIYTYIHMIIYILVRS